MSAQGSLCLHQGVLWVGSWEKTAHVRSFDLDGRPLEARFSFRDPERPRSAACGLAVDDERLVWVADAPGGCLRAFNLFGRQVQLLRASPALEGRAQAPASDRARGDVPGALGEPVDVVVTTAEVLGGDPDAGPYAVVLSDGVRRHAVQVFELETQRLLHSMRPEGSAQSVFRGARRAAVRGAWTWVCEETARRVQVFRSGVFHFAFTPPGDCAPLALAPLPDGRLLLALSGHAGGVVLTDASGALQRQVVPAGRSEGEALDADDIAFVGGPDERHARVVVQDRDGGRVQVFSLDGRCYGAFDELVS